MVKSPILKQRLFNQRLAGNGLRRPEDVVAWLGAVQAQDYTGAKWALGMRGESFDENAVDRAFDEGRILRTHILRPTWHFVAPADLRAFLSVSGPRVTTVNAYYYRHFEVDARLLVKSDAAIAVALSGRQYLTRNELAMVLARNRIDVRGHRLAAVVMHAELEGLICSGPRRGKQFTYALMDERVPRSRVQPSDQVLAELTKRYFSSHGPATTKDFAWWSGQTIAQAKLGIMLIERDLDRLEKNGLTYWSIPIDDARGRSFSSTYLLPNYDEFLIAYKNRNEVLADPKQRVLRPPSIEEPPHHVILDGQLAGSWRRSVKGSDVHVDVQLFTATPSKRHRREIVAAAGRLSTFLNVPVKMAIA